MNRIIAILIIITLLWSNISIIYADTIKIPQWPFEESACVVIRSAQDVIADRKTLYDYSNAVMPNETATANPEDLIYFHLDNYVESDFGVGIKNDISKAELVITNADKRLYEIKYPADNPRGITINGNTQIKSISSFLEYIIVPANMLYGECKAALTVTRDDEITETYKFYIDVQTQYLPLDVSEIDIREVNHADGIKSGHIFLKGIKGLIGFSNPDIMGEFSVTSMNGMECYIASSANLQQLFDEEFVQGKYDSIDIPFHYDGLEHHYQLTIPKGLLLLESGLNEEYTLEFDVNISVSDYILRFSPEDGSTIMMDTESQTESIFIDIAKPCQITDGMKIFVNGSTVNYIISDEENCYRISFNLNIEAGQHYAISLENNTIVLPNGVTNEKTERFSFDTVHKGSVDVFDATAFRDLPQEHWAYSYISELVGKGIISGYEDGTFKPESYVTRGELSKLLTVAFEKTTEQSSRFGDVDNHWAEKYIDAMQQIIPMRDDSENANFYPDEYATREEVAASIALLVDVSHDSIINSFKIVTPFYDEAEIREDLRANVNFAVYLGIIYGYDDNYFKPHKNITRSEIAAMIYRSLEID